ncbi:MAG: hypothetical protein AAF449_04720 [Myxococcota bacterium]
MDPTLSWIDASEVRAALAQVRRTDPDAPTQRPDQLEGPEQNNEALTELTTPVTLVARIQGLARWVDHHVRPSRWFLADREGLPVYDGGFGEPRIAELTQAIRPWCPAGRPVYVDAVTFHVSGGHRVVVRWIDTALGPLAAAFQDPQMAALDPAVQAIERAMGAKVA